MEEQRNKKLKLNVFIGASIAGWSIDLGIIAIAGNTNNIILVNYISSLCSITIVWLLSEYMTKTKERRRKIRLNWPKKEQRIWTVYQLINILAIGFCIKNISLGLGIDILYSKAIITLPNFLINFIICKGLLKRCTRNL